jgi:hypothetical protein
LFSAPQHSQLKTFLSVPLLAGRRFPQSMQKTREPIAAIALCVVCCTFMEDYVAIGKIMSRLPANDVRKKVQKKFMVTG